MKISGIYKITNPAGHVYIGQSIDCEKRKYQYRKRPASQQVKLYRSIKKYGWDAHTFEIVGYCEPIPEWLDDMEKGFISLFNTFNTKQGMNLRLGGRGGARFSDESRQRMSKSAKGKHISFETREAMRRAQLGRKHPEEVKRKISEGQRGEKANKWGSGKPVLQFTRDGEFVRRFTSANSVQRKTGIPAQNIQAACRNNAGQLPSGRKPRTSPPRKSTGTYSARGYIWKYE